MNKALWSKKALAVPACAAIVLGGVMLTAVPANANPADLKVTSSSVDGRTLTVKGRGTAGESIQLSEDFNATRHTISRNGTWTITYAIPGTDYASHTYTVQQLRGLNRDGSTTVTAAAEVPEFAITAHTVSGRTITVSGTGNPDNTVQIDPQSAPIIRHQIADDGTWSFTYDIPGTGTESNTYSVFEENSNFQIQAQDTFTAAAEAATPTVELTLITPADGDTVDSRTVTFTGTGTPGDAIGVLSADGTTLVAPATVVGEDGNWTTTGTFSDSAGVTQDLTVSEIGTNLAVVDTIDFTITLPAVASAPGDDDTDPGTGTGTGGTGTGGTGTSSVAGDTSTAQPSGTTVGSLPVVSG